ncbi:MAG: hypothetical protein H6P98_1522, partial [Candidatus Aminicenantes bacterium]|nr:hypothetical protein [Candidatus Aminicenantes bacterium]
VTVLEKNVAQVLEKYGLEIPDLWAQPDGLVAESAKKLVPDTLESALRRAHDDLEENFESLRAEIIAFEPTLEGSLNLARGKLDQQWKFLEIKIRQAAAKRNETVGRQLRKAAGNIYPSQRLQERILNIVPYLIKYGDAFLERLDRAVDIGEHDHQVVVI